MQCNFLNAHLFFWDAPKFFTFFKSNVSVCQQFETISFSLMSLIFNTDLSECDEKEDYIENKYLWCKN